MTPTASVPQTSNPKAVEALETNLSEITHYHEVATSLLTLTDDDILHGWGMAAFTWWETVVDSVVYRLQYRPSATDTKDNWWIWQADDELVIGCGTTLELAITRMFKWVTKLPTNLPLAPVAY